MNDTRTLRFPDAPPQIKALRVEHRGFPVPWFVHWNDDKPDFRVIASGKINTAVQLRRCWVCGGPLGRLNAFVIGPMCAVNRISSEPPCHLDCASFAAKCCPFLANPRMRRNEKDMPEGSVEADGNMIKRNPGVTLVWASLRYKQVGDGRGGTLFSLGRAERVAWYAQGREATRDEVLHSIETGYPLLEAEAKAEGREAILALKVMREEAMKLVPKAA